MLKLSDIQKNFLLENFFKNEQYAGWKNVATKLLENGSCIVAGESCIWVGGIGNFIDTKKDENAFGCLLYKFDLDAFLRSALFSEVASNRVEFLTEKVKELETEVEGLNSISDYSKN